MAKTRYAQAQAIANTGFLGMVEASVMKVAWDVLQDTENADFTQRAGLARLLLGGDAPRALVESYIRRFAWFVVNVPKVQGESYATGVFKPADIADETIDAAVAAFWNTSANVMPFTPDVVTEAGTAPVQTQLFAGPSPVS